MHSVFLKFTLHLQCGLMFCKLLVLECLVGMSRILHCLMSVPLPDAHQLLMSFAETLTYLEPRTLS
jgi:hypothetical protein